MMERRKISVQKKEICCLFILFKAASEAGDAQAIQAVFASIMSESYIVQIITTRKMYDECLGTRITVWMNHCCRLAWKTKH